MTDLRPAARLPLLALGALSLIGGVLAGLARLGWTMPDTAAQAAAWHGALMIPAFLGTVISLERAVALARGWPYLAPAAAGAGGVALIAGVPVLFPQVLFTAAAAILVAASVQVLRRLVTSFTLVLALAALCWLVGNIVWIIEGNITTSVPWWLTFLVLTIAGERLELTRLLPTPAIARHLFFAAVCVIMAGATIALRTAEAGLVLLASGYLALAAWLMTYDLARRNARTKGSTRFIAVALLSGYAWLAFAGLLGVAGGFMPGHAWRDAALHAVALGFVFSMIFGHALIIFPAVARVRIPYRPMFYLPLAALHASLMLRIVGSLTGRFSLRHDGGLVNAVALLLFIGTLLGTVLHGRRESAQEASSRSEH